MARAIAAPEADDPLVAAATLLIAAGYRVIPPGRPDPEARDGATLADDAPDEERGGQAPARLLSARELDVLAQLTEGAPNKVIARRLGISVHTAKFHVASILAKLGAANRTDAIAIAMREGLVLL
ncbi:MAG: response regulator transcription factor [Rhizobiaceae bacterium]|nr:response regulator transcription factor [Rhizobiaceae bacterium]